MDYPRCVVFGLVALAWSGTAGAASFSSDGALEASSDAVAFESFEADARGLAVQVGPALHGKRYARLAGGSEQSFVLNVPEWQGSVRVRAFQRGALAASYATSSTGTYAPLYPTGRVTSDEWVEIASAPLSIPDGQLRLTFRNAADQPVDLDAVEIAPAGPANAPVACKPPQDDVCGAGRCLAGLCVGAGQRVPPLPAEPERSQLPAYFSSLFDAFFGGIATRRDHLPNARARLLEMGAAPNADAYWRAFAGAFHELHDSHSAAFVGVLDEASLPACFVAGEADLSRSSAPSDPTYPDILVSHALGSGGVLQAGDRLVAIEGQHPLAFARGLGDAFAGVLFATDPLSYGGLVRDLPTVIRTHASTITVVRCGGTGTCGAPEVLSVASLPRLPTGQALSCDQRPAYHQAVPAELVASHDLGTQVFAGPLQEATSQEPGFYGLLFDSLYPATVPSPFTKALGTLRDAATHVVLDHRLGTGGTTLHATRISQLFSAPRRVVASAAPITFLARPGFGESDGASVFVQSADSFEIGSTSARTDLRVAVLLARDLSASDFLALGSKNQPNVRSFGARTDGAFSTLGMVSWGGGALLASFGSGDAFGPDGTPLIGRGVVPDEELLPRQSDLVAHVDTVYVRALGWLREAEQAP